MSDINTYRHHCCLSKIPKSFGVATRLFLPHISIIDSLRPTYIYIHLIGFENNSYGMLVFCITQARQ